MKKFIAALTLLYASSVYALDFKGIHIGKPATPDQISEKLNVKCGVGANQMQICNGPVTIARESAHMNLVINAQGVVQRIGLTLPSDAFDIIMPLLVEKFDTPAKTTRNDVQNRMGVHFEQIVHLWRGEDDVELLFTKYAGNLDHSVLYFSTREDRELLVKDKTNRRGDI